MPAEVLEALDVKPMTDVADIVPHAERSEPSGLSGPVSGSADVRSGLAGIGMHRPGQPGCR